MRSFIRIILSLVNKIMEVAAVKNARLIIDRNFVIAPVDPRIFGSFTEHLGRCIYEGLYQPGHVSADSNGFRQDVLDLVRDFGVTVVRYPGGNFVSGYNWEDGIGPKAGRPVRADLAWHVLETNQFGTDEFISWCRQASCEPMLALNLGTRGVPEALQLLEYCNFPAGTRLSDLRIANGSSSPHAVKLWCLGNEMDGLWQLGHKTAYEYGRLAAEVSRAMKELDPTIETVACGSSNSQMPLYGSWESEVLAQCYDEVDYLSLHHYFNNKAGDTPEFL
ncbi:MAG: alpha-L-arabinofuranosidase, partial [Symbiobacteriaceae bacterium]|nr:alpha-L-arabinofuranosidase [Symbiobacteriaceae bacterium]